MLVKLYDAYKWVYEYDSIDLAINHDPTFSRIWGNGNAVRDMSRDEIKSQLPGICFFAEYLNICKAYHMVPVIEFKDPYMSAEAINKALDMVNERGDCAFALGACYADYLLAEALKEHLSFAGYLAFQLRNRLFQYDSRALEHHIEAVKAVLISMSADKLHTIGDIVGFAVNIIEVCNS